MAGRGAAIPRYRRYSGPAVLSQGFRPFFLGAGVWAVAGMLLWSGVLLEGVPLPTAFRPAVWHAHAMLFGFVGAAMAGFLATAVPNWTGRMPIQGAPLAMLAGLWALGRLACATSGVIGAPAAMILDLLFFLALPAALAREVVAGRNWRNLPVVGATLVVAGANALVHLDPVAGVDSGYGLRLAIGAFAFLIALVGGRIVPSFTRNWLAKRDGRHRPASANRADRAVVALTGLAAAAWTGWPDHAVTGVLSGGAALANAWRLSRWQGHRTWREPLLLVLHVGYAWLAVGFGLLALAALSDAVAQTTALHALTAGAMGTMPAAVMTRATLGHTGRALTGGAGSAALFALVALAAALRLAAPMSGGGYLSLLGASALAWIAGFGLYVALYGPLQMRPR
ncbi:NnrS family protein [Rhodovibrio salinarum]|uniref:NnrS family protein n=1 Tax=Rhodovibrio salinarum TaxID=1087 RepID=A0A934QKS7_9PROT|nr:NnrS family protein [Rhodovibrio salinarum]MBK1698718.1 hypothetical protein [Rhodovibrio salinarum]